MLSIETDNKPDPNWNKRLLQTKTGTIHQTKEFALMLSSRLKSTPLYLKFYNNSGEVVGQVLVHKSFRGKGKAAKLFGWGSIYSMIAKASKLFPPFYHWTYGPVIFDDSYKSQVSDLLGNFLTSNGSKFYGMLHPLDPYFDFPQKLNFHKKAASTYIIDLKQDLEQILNNTNKKSVKKNIERSKKRGVTITQVKSKKDLTIYYDLSKEHRLKNKLMITSLKDFLVACELFKPLGTINFLAWYDEIPVGAISMSTFNGYVVEGGIARSAIDTEKKLYSMDHLRWKIIETSVQNKYKYYDLAGVKPSNRSPKEENIFRNKKKWGGKKYDFWIFKN